MWEYLVVAVDEVPGTMRSPHQPEDEIAGHKVWRLTRSTEILNALASDGWEPFLVGGNVYTLRRPRR